MAINMKNTPPAIEINGARYALHMSDNDVLALCREARRRVMDIHIGAEDEALSFLQWAAERLDRLLGEGAAAIFEGAPVDLAGMLGLYNAIAAERSAAHRQYIKDRYGV